MIVKPTTGEDDGRVIMKELHPYIEFNTIIKYN